MKSIDYAKLCCNSVIEKYPSGVIPPYAFHYHAGVFLHGMEEVFLITDEKKYDDYILKWLNHYVAKNGWIIGREEMSVDAVMGTNHLLRYAKNRSDLPHFDIALKYIADRFFTWKCNKYGGFFHKGHTENQMWLDSTYMASMFLARYGVLVNEKKYLDLAERQMDLLWEHARDEKSGLLYHAWDAGIEAPWANKETGCSPEIWGRAFGWYYFTASFMAELLPEGEFKKKILKYCIALSESIIKYCDEKTGLWYQVTNKPNTEGNWIEISSSCLFMASLAKLIRIGILNDDVYINTVKSAYDSLIKGYISIENNNLFIENVCIGTGVGDYDFYINRPTVNDDLHGMGAFILMAAEYYKLFNE